MKNETAVILVIVALVLTVFFLTGCVAPQTVTMSPEEAVNQSITVEYEELYRNAEKYKGEIINITGEVIQVIPYTNTDRYYQLRVATSEWYSDIVLIEKYSGETLMDGDQVEIYGEYNGLYSYEAVFGQSVTVPSIKYVTGGLKQ